MLSVSIPFQCIFFQFILILIRNLSFYTGKIFSHDLFIFCSKYYSPVCNENISVETVWYFYSVVFCSDVSSFFFFNSVTYLFFFHSIISFKFNAKCKEELPRMTYRIGFIWNFCNFFFIYSI